MAERSVYGWDIGGAHVKVARWSGGTLHDVAQWPCALWQGLDRLEAVLVLARQRWPDLADAARAAHAVTMTGEMVDLFEHREQGVARIAAALAATVPAPRFFAGDAPWCDAEAAAVQWEQIASANWLATGRHVAAALADREGVLVDIGSTTTDLIAFRRGRVLARGRSDAQRLARSELVYHGVVRTPLCALARRIRWRGETLNVMNELFATSADVYRLTGELDPAHDQHPSADGAAKDVAHTQARLARMIGLDARDGSAAEWLAFAHDWRTEQLGELRGQLERVVGAHALRRGAVLVAAGCGAFLVPELDARSCLPYGGALAPLAADAGPEVATWAQVCAPAVAVAALFERESR